MAFDIMQPNVGQKMLQTFSTIAEFNRKRQADEMRLQAAAQNQAMMSQRLDLQALGLDLRGQNALNKNTLDRANLALDSLESANKAAKAEADLADRAAEKQTGEVIKEKADALNAALGLPEDDGLSINQKIYSGDPEVARDAIQRAIAAIDASGLNANRGDKRAKDILDTWENRLQKGNADIYNSTRADMDAKKFADKQKRDAEAARRADAREGRLIEGFNISKEAKQRALDAASKKDASPESVASEAFVDSKKDVPGYEGLTLNKIRLILSEVDKNGNPTENSKALADALIKPVFGIGGRKPTASQEQINEWREDGSKIRITVEEKKGINPDGVTPTGSLIPSPDEVSGKGKTKPAMGLDKYLSPNLPPLPSEGDQVNPAEVPSASNPLGLNRRASDFFGLPRDGMLT